MRGGPGAGPTAAAGVVIGGVVAVLVAGRATAGRPTQGQVEGGPGGSVRRGCLAEGGWGGFGLEVPPGAGVGVGGLAGVHSAHLPVVSGVHAQAHGVAMRGGPGVGPGTAAGVVVGGVETVLIAGCAAAGCPGESQVEGGSGNRVGRSGLTEGGRGCTRIISKNCFG